MNKTENKTLIYSMPEKENWTSGKKTVRQIVDELKSKGINAELSTKAK